MLLILVVVLIIVDLVGNYILDGGLDHTIRQLCALLLNLTVCAAMIAIPMLLQLRLVVACCLVVALIR